MFPFKITIDIKALTQEEAQKKANEAMKIANNVDAEALEILQIASARPGASKKVKNFKRLLKNL